MGEQIIVGIVGVLVLGILAQWISWRMKIPSILLLLVFGLIAGPIGGFVNPDQLLGDLLFPIVSLSVAIILFEGGLNLRFLRTPDARKVTFRLITVGLMITWFVGASAAYFILALPLELAVLLGAVLTVSGPTVILPILRSVRPKGTIGQLLKWEGILIDPVGALIAVLVFEAILAQDLENAPFAFVSGIVQTAVIGSFFGMLGALLIIWLFRRHLLPDYLQNPFTLTVVMSVHVLSNHFYPESGLLAVTLMAVVLANTKGISIRHVLDFKEDLTNLIVSSLFILLSARIPRESLLELDWGKCIIFLLVLIIVGRPLAVLFSTINGGLSVRERLFLSAVAPRGIIAAAVSSVFAFELAAAGHPGAEQLVSYTFAVIIGTVIVYGLSARPIARFLKVGDADAQGVLIVGANLFARRLAQELNKNEIATQLIDSNILSVQEARQSGLRAHLGNVLAEELLDELDLSGIGCLISLTPNDEINALAALRFGDLFERSKLCQLAEQESLSENSVSSTPQHLRGRFLFGRDLTYRVLEEKLMTGGQIQTIDIPENVGSDNFSIENGSIVPLAVVPSPGKLEIIAADNPYLPRKGNKVVALVSANAVGHINDE